MIKKEKKEPKVVGANIDATLNEIRTKNDLQKEDGFNCDHVQEFCDRFNISHLALDVNKNKIKDTAFSVEPVRKN
jgi:hypothetical protein